MPRPIRIQYKNAWYHVMNRGIDHQVIYQSNLHRKIFYELLDEVVEKFKIEIHAFCLMGNHYHLLVKTPAANLDHAMHHLNGMYAQRYNRLVERDGPLFRGRYKAILIEWDPHLLQVSRYIHLNPVEAKICTKPCNYIWSSYRYYIHKINLPWLSTTFISQMFGSNPVTLYADFVEQGVDKMTQNFYKQKRISSIFRRATLPLQF